MTKKIKQEQGRSMVEMLGVLAIIGVLSVGGIAGYKSAITKHRANETIDRLLKRAVVIAGQVGLGQQADISGFNPQDGTYTIPNGITTPQGQFVITVEDVPEEVCQKIKDMWTLPTIIPSDSCSGTDDMTFTFANDLSEAGQNVVPSGTECESTCTAATGTAGCNNGYCECEAGTWIATDPQDPTKGTCLEDGTGCANNKDCNDGSEQGDYYCNHTGKVSGSAPTARGVCKTASATVLQVGTTEYKRSQVTFDWWSARDFCKALGMHMMTLDELECTTTEIPSESLAAKLHTAEAGMPIISWTNTLKDETHAYYVGRISSVGNGVRSYIDKHGDDDVGGAGYGVYCAP